jgi:SAM-dependent methyltransferase
VPAERGTSTGEDDYVASVRSLYDRVTGAYVAHCSETLQAGLIDDPTRRDLPPPTASNLWLAARAGVADGERLLDLGCGVCGPAADIATAWPTVRIDAITVSPVQAALAADRLAAAGLADRVTPHCLDYHALPFPDASFDLVYFFESSGYTWDPVRLFREVHRVLRPGGRVYIKDLFARPGPYTADEQADIDGVNRLWAMRQVPTMPDWQARLEAAGFAELSHRRLTEATSDFYWGAMFDDDLTLNPFGELFFRDFPLGGLVFYGEVRGRRP